MSKELADAKKEIAAIVEFYLPRLTVGRALSAEQFLELEAELTAAVTKGATVGEKYAHEKPTIPAPARRDRDSNESGVLPSVALHPPPVPPVPRIPSLPRKPR
jgi:hypothetical protein